MLEARLTATLERRVHDAFGAQTSALISRISALVLIVATNALAVLAG